MSFVGGVFRFADFSGRLGCDSLAKRPARGFCAGAGLDDSRRPWRVSDCSELANVASANVCPERSRRIRPRARAGTGVSEGNGRVWCTNEERPETPRSVMSLPACAVASRRRTRHALLAAQPHAHSEAASEYRRSRNDAARDAGAAFAGLSPPRDVWVVTNAEQAAAVRRELPEIPPSHVLAEPVGANTAAAIGLAAIHLAHEHGDALMAVLPSDSYIADAAAIARSCARRWISRARREISWFWAFRPRVRRPATAISSAAAWRSRPRGVAAYAVRRFTEKPALPVARKYVASGKLSLECGNVFLARLHVSGRLCAAFFRRPTRRLQELAKSIGTRRYTSALRRIYPRIEEYFRRLRDHGAGHARRRIGHAFS